MPCISEVGHATVDDKCANMEAMIEELRKYSCRPTSTKFGDALPGHHHADFEDEVK